MDSFRTALITGATGGIGTAYAQALAGAGMDLILVARSVDKLAKLAKSLKGNEGVRVETIASDLAQPSPGEPLAFEVKKRGLEVDLLINNAGFGTFGAFRKQSAAREQEEIMLNAAAVVNLSHAFLPDMLERKRGGIINVASMAAFQPLPYMAVYAATKAFVLSFSEGLRSELKGLGVQVLAVCPGPVDTGFFEATGNKKARSSVPKATMMDAQRVVADSLRSLKAGDGICVPGYANKAVALSSKLMPRAVVAAVISRVMKR